MENASKALIIAGAILIAIVLITLGVVILQQGDKTTGTGEAALNSREIESFNSTFTRYEGTSVSGTNVRALINAVRSSNAAQNNSGSGHLVKINSNADNETGFPKASAYNPGTKYKVNCEYGTDGYVNNITIE